MAEAGDASVILITERALLSISQPGGYVLVIRTGLEYGIREPGLHRLIVRVDSKKHQMTEAFPAGRGWPRPIPVGMG